ncbi:Hsp70 family protein [Mycobacterium sp. 1423905.2]|uniref:Hsp70 family protein n=1 Tax=Mycobacterium sp. 1423905.2 TaxID=1856859 RepID=UPI0007FCCBC9|nr:Hsp70 family protein [Mycobacterium sp. 1423905.2]OBJ53385.1 hypothetical protein A9W95_18135 [Mycobacterium sp. 1423905.2]
MYDPLGLSIGSTNLVAAGNGRAPVIRRAVLTLYPHCAPKVGVYPQDSDSTQSGMLMSGFVERIGDSVALVSPDGSAHDPDLLMVEALDAMVVSVGADASCSEIVIGIPAHWKPATIQALRNGLRTHVGFVRSGMAPRLVPDSVTAVTAAHAELTLPQDGIIGLLDFGGTGTSVTLLAHKTDFEPISATVRYRDFSGEEIDQALLQHVFEEIGHGGDLDSASTTALGRLAQLKENCREAKERLSTDAVTELAVDLPGRNRTLQLSRDQLQDLIQDRLTGFIYAFDDMLARNNASFGDLAAVVTVGGGANIPLVTERLSVHTRRPVLTVAQPACAAAAGALVLAGRGRELSFRTRTSIGLAVAAAGAPRADILDVPAGDVMVIDQDALTDRELAWSQTEFPVAPPAPFVGDAFSEEGPCFSMRLNLIEPPKDPPWRRFRLSQLLIGACAVVAVTAIGGVAITLTSLERQQAPHTPTVPTVAPLPAPPSSIPPSPVAPSALLPSPAPPSPVPPPPTEVPAPSVAPPPSVETPPPPPPPPSPPPPPRTTTRPPVATTTPPPVRATTTAPTTTEPTTTEPTTTEPPPTTTSTVQMTTQWLHLPLVPVPIPVPVPATQAPAPPPAAPVMPAPVPQNPYYYPGVQ